MAAAVREIVINAPLERVYKLIIDYEKYREFNPELRSVKILQRNGPATDVEYEIELVATSIKYSVRIKEEPPNRVSWTFIKGEYMKDNHGSWQLQALSPTQTKAIYTLELAVGFMVPKAIVTKLAETQLPKMLEAFKAAAERMAP